MASTTAHSDDRREREISLDFAGLVAHQLKSPVAAAASIIKTLLGEYAGHLNPRQKDLLAKADRRIEEAIESVRRMLMIIRPRIEDEEQAADAAATARRATATWTEECIRRGITLETVVRLDPAWVRISLEGLAEVLQALLSNALKYTPDQGRIRVIIEPGEEGMTVLAVEDSGIGVPQDQRDKIFEPFYRSTEARRSARPGVGLGLAFVKAVVEAYGGRIIATSSELGGAAFRMLLPTGNLETASAGNTGRPRVVIIGGVAAGPKVAAKVIRLRPETEVTIIERGDLLSYAGCGLPYYVSGVVSEQKQLLATPLGVVRDSVFFQNVKNVRTLNRTEALEIDRSGRRVRVRRLDNGSEQWIFYDKLVLATGARPIVPDLPGVRLRNIFTLHGVRDAEGIRNALAEGRARDVVLVGGGLIAVEMTKALTQRGCRVTIVERLGQILRMFDPDMARLVELHLEANGVRVRTGTEVLGFAGGETVEAVRTNHGDLPADLVILSAGVRPETTLAAAAGLEIGVTGAIRVDARMCTSDPDIYAVGDCVECIHRLTGRPCYVPLGSTANKQGRTAAINLCGGNDIFPGILGTTICNVFEYCAARTGLTEAEAREAGYDPVSVLVPAPDREHFLPEARLLMMKLIVDRRTRQLLGAQAVGPGQGDKRVDVASTAIAAGMTVDQVASLDLGYAPPYAPAMDNLITAANVARNKLDGQMDGITPEEVWQKLQRREDFIFLDVSTPLEYERARLPGSRSIPLGALRGRLGELPRDREIITFCTLSIRGYEAALILRAAGFTRVRVMEGGTAMWPYEKIRGV